MGRESVDDSRLEKAGTRAGAPANIASSCPSTVYGITGKGRRALRRWLAGGNALRALVLAVAKIFFADQGTKQELLTNMRSVRDEAGRYLEHLDHLAPRKPWVPVVARFPGARTSTL
jgi:hypothetical protein